MLVVLGGWGQPFRHLLRIRFQWFRRLLLRQSLYGDPCLTFRIRLLFFYRLIGLLLPLWLLHLLARWLINASFFHFMCRIILIEQICFFRILHRRLQKWSWFKFACDWPRRCCRLWHSFHILIVVRASLRRAIIRVQRDRPYFICCWQLSLRYCIRGLIVINFGRIQISHIFHLRLWNHVSIRLFGRSRQSVILVWSYFKRAHWSWPWMHLQWASIQCIIHLMMMVIIML